MTAFHVKQDSHTSMVARASAVIAVCFAAASAAAAQDALSIPRPAVTSAQRLDAWLARERIPGLEALVLEERLKQTGANRLETARRLAEVYAQAIESALDDAARQSIEERAARLLADVPEVDSPDLRLTLARGAYKRAEETAERVRLRLASAGEAEAAERTLSDLAKALTELALQATRRVEQLEKQEENVSGASDRALLSEGLAISRRTRSMAHFLAGWTSVYAGELAAPGAAKGHAQEALRHFGWLLNAKSGEAPSLDRVPEQNISFEHVARSMIGVAMAHSLAGDDIEALRWLDKLGEGDKPPEAVAGQLLSRRLIVLARAGRWNDAAVAIPRGEGGVIGASLTTTDARLVTVMALDAMGLPGAPAAAQSLAQSGLAALAAQGQIAQVLDLAARYQDRLDALLESEFMGAYIRGLREFDRARRASKDAGDADDKPATSSVAVEAYAAAERLLSQALSSGDARRFGAALGGVGMMRARSAFGSARTAAELSTASQRFIAASATLREYDADQGALAMRMALRAIDLAIEKGETQELKTARRSAADIFIRDYPTNPAAAALMYERSLSGAVPTDMAVEDLLQLAERGGRLAATSRYQAARLLYERWRTAEAAQKPALAARFLKVAEPGLDDGRRVTASDGAEAARFAATHARRVLDVALSGASIDVAAARRAADLLQSLLSRALVPAENMPAELEYRRVQIAIASGDGESAELAVTRLEGLDAALGASALRMVYQLAADEWNAADAGSEERSRLDERIDRLGTLVLSGVPDRSAALRDPAMATVHAMVARAVAGMWQRTGRRDLMLRADAMFTALLEAWPRDADILVSAGRFWFDSANTSKALAAWRTLSSGLPQGEPGWFEARWRTLKIVASLEPDKAREALANHLVLYPDYGPEPWGPKLRELADTLAAAGTGSGAGGEP
jgi:hypothetical protein